MSTCNRHLSKTARKDTKEHYHRWEPRGGPSANHFAPGPLQCVVSCTTGLPGAEAAEGDEQSSKIDCACPQGTVYNSDVAGPALAADGAWDKVEGVGVRLKAVHSIAPAWAMWVLWCRWEYLHGRTLRSSTGPARLDPPKRHKRTRLHFLFRTSALHMESAAGKSWETPCMFLTATLLDLPVFELLSLISTPPLLVSTLHYNFMRLMAVIFRILSGHWALFTLFSLYIILHYIRLVLCNFSLYYCIFYCKALWSVTITKKVRERH